MQLALAEIRSSPDSTSPLPGRGSPRSTGARTPHQERCSSQSSPGPSPPPARVKANECVLVTRNMWCMRCPLARFPCVRPKQFLGRQHMQIHFQRMQVLFHRCRDDEFLHALLQCRWRSNSSMHHKKLSQLPLCVYSKKNLESDKRVCQI